MTELTIRRLTVASSDVPDDVERGPRVRRMLANLAAARLGDALATVALPPGDWCIRRLDVKVPVDLDRPDPAVEVDWAAALVAALTTAVATSAGTGDPTDVVHYPRSVDALTDLVGGLAVGRVDRAWAWAQLGLVAPGAIAAPAAAALAALRAHPSHALPAIARVVGTSGVPALHRLLGSAGWTEVARIVAAAVGRTPPVAVDGLTDLGSTAATTLVSPELIATLTARSGLAARFRRAGLRLDPATAAAWATLVAVEADPSILCRARAPALVRALAAGWAAAPGPSGPGGPGANLDDHRSGGEPSTTAHPAVSTPATAPTLPGTAAGTLPGLSGLTGGDRRASAQDATSRTDSNAWATGPAADVGHGLDSRTRWPTPWAGLLFLIATADEAGIPAGPLEDPALGARPLWWTLHQIAQRLVPAPAGDPAVLAFAGLRPEEVHLVERAAPPGRDERERIHVHAAGWAAATVRRLAGPGEPAGPDASRPEASGAAGPRPEPPIPEADGRAGESGDTVAAIALRLGEIVAERGWIEVELRLADVDLEVRRAGLDVDPDWVPWLGAVVRYVYA